MWSGGQIGVVCKLVESALLFARGFHECDGQSPTAPVWTSFREQRVLGPALNAGL